MDFLALSRRELQALCKRNAVRANMSNAAMADALRALPSVDGFEEIGTTVPPPVSAIKSVEEVIIEEEKKDGIPLSRGGRARSRARTAAADRMEQDAPDQGALQGSQGTGAREPGAPVDREEVIGKEQGHGCSLPRGGRARAKTRKAASHKTEEAVVAPETLQLQGSQRTASGEGMAPVEAEEVATGKRRTRRSGRSKVRMASDQKEEVPAVAHMEQKVVSDKCCNDPKEQEVVMVVEEEATKPEEDQNVTRRMAVHEAKEEVPAPAFLRRSQRTVAPEGMASVEVEEVGTGKRRTRRSARSKVALDQKETEEVAVWKDTKADSSDVAIGSAVVSDKSCNDPKTHKAVVVVEEDITKGQNVTRRPAAHEMEEVPAPAILRRSQRTAVPVEEEEVATAKKRTRRSTRSKVAAASRKGQKADSSDTTIGSADKSSIGPNEDEVVAIMEEETTKPHDGGNVIRKAMAHKMEEVPLLATLQQSQRTAALDATAPVEAEEGATTKRRRRPRRSKVAAAAQNGQKADSSDAAIGSPVLVSDRSCGDFREDQLVAVVEEHVAKPQEGIVDDQEQSRTIHKSACSGKMEDPPTVSILLSKPEAIDVHDKAESADKKTIKEDCFTLTSEADQSDLLVNTLDRFSKPMYEFTVKGEKKDGECWWMLM
ncbi:hypothetical protein SEVIR_5G176900v4 [Setaria viridis]|uniref:Uncharacterized protein n=1 Tax=Setaria viridis TaxID=4556 RepID=A0A4V6D6J1_SETVI|nr:uncharacterized protein LOC117854774 isoform X1 [Setaria viridis]TKW14566.1 hypothetical protein SEVIR_5G176900v2 [Setaria viridis]